MNVPKSVYEHIDKYCEKLGKDSKLARLYKNCYPNTLETTLSETQDGGAFVLTGDIPAMWLRDSTAQVSHYIPLAKEDPELCSIISAVIKTQFSFILKDPYANAFNAAPNSHGHVEDLPKNNPWVWERKYEIDSLCYPLRLAYLYWKGTGNTDIFDKDFLSAAKAIVSLWKTEQNHAEKSPYTFVRQGCPPEDKDTLPNKGYGNPVAYTGMTWSGFRPSDDSCIYGYLVPSNMFAVVVLGYLDEILKSFYAKENEFISECNKLKCEIDSGIKKYAVYDHPEYGEIYACEADGFGNVRLFDDANVPSLLSIPYIGYAPKDDEMYLRTRNFILSNGNPYYYKGKYAKGIGSPHTPEGYIWHIALSMQALTSNDDDEIREIINTLVSTDADTGYMHEGFDADDPKKFSREWFAWSNSLFAELIEQAVNKGII